METQSIRFDEVNIENVLPESPAKLNWNWPAPFIAADAKTGDDGGSTDNTAFELITDPTTLLTETE